MDKLSREQEQQRRVLSEQMKYEPASASEGEREAGELHLLMMQKVEVCCGLGIQKGFSHFAFNVKEVRAKISHFLLM